MTGPIVSNGGALADLLPAFYLMRDAQASGGNRMLAALLELLDAEVAEIEAELARRYASLFIETCTDDDLQYFAALLGVRQLPGNQHPRALIGNIISYRRGKGTIATLERVAAAVSGWNAHAVEYFGCWPARRTSIICGRPIPMWRCATRRRWTGREPRSTRWPTWSTSARSPPTAADTTSPTSGCTCGGWAR